MMKTDARPAEELVVTADAAVLDAYGHRPYWRGRLHLIAAVVSVPAVAVLLATRTSMGSRLAVAVFGASLVGLYSVSATYHRAARTESAVTWFRRLDHSMIYILIAGTYTPFCVLALPRAWGIPLLVGIWVTAIVGIALKMGRMSARAPSASWIYIVMGWAVILTLPALVHSITVAQACLLAVGGLLYTVGAIVLWRRWPNPLPDTFGYHEVWHGMTIAAATCHFVAVAMLG